MARPVRCRERVSGDAIVPVRGVASQRGRRHGRRGVRVRGPAGGAPLRGRDGRRARRGGACSGGSCTRRDPAALDALVARHGPMVLGVCRRVLGNSHDAEDAFQAVFLVLVRSARSIRDPRPARAVAARRGASRGGAGARRRGDPQATRVAPGRRTRRWRPTAVSAAATCVRAGRTAGGLDDEIARLPERFRAPVVLCYLDGLTHERGRRAAALPGRHRQESPGHRPREAARATVPSRGRRGVSAAAFWRRSRPRRPAPRCRPVLANRPWRRVWRMPRAGRSPARWRGPLGAGRSRPGRPPWPTE